MSESKRDRSEKRGEDVALSESPDPVIGLDSDRAAAMLPEDLLQGDETIILLMKPSMWYVLLASLETLALIAVIGVVGWWAEQRFEMGWYNPKALAAMCGLLGAIRLFAQLVEWFGRTYVLTDRRVVRIMGVFRRQMFQCELGRLQHTNVIRTFRERVCGVGTISFATAGTGFPEAYWMMVRHPMAVHKKIIQAINRYQR